MCLLLAFAGGYYKERLDGHLQSGYIGIMFFVIACVIIGSYVILICMCACCSEYIKKRGFFRVNNTESFREESILNNDDVPIELFTLN